MGHAVRASAILEALAHILPLELTVIAGCQPDVWPFSLARLVSRWDRDPVDVGVAQSDDVTVDLVATRAALRRWLLEFPATLIRERERLAGRFDLVFGDVPPLAFQAAKSAGIQSVAVANFSWDWIYSELGFYQAAEVAAQGYDQASLMLEATPFAPMRAFRRRVGVGLIARPPSLRQSARESLGLTPDQNMTLLAFQPASVPNLLLPKSREGRTLCVPAGWPDVGGRSDVRVLAPDGNFLDAIAAADVVVGKPGYGLIGDVEAAGARFLYVPRPGFPENVILERYLCARGGTSRLDAKRLAGHWEEELGALEQVSAPLAAKADGAARAAREIAALLGVDSGPDTE